MTNPKISNKSATPSYDFLKEQFDQKINLERTIEILYKDSETVMAAGSGEDRVRKITVLGNAVHRIIADPRIEEALENASHERLAPVDRRNLQLMRHSWIHEAGLPADLASEISRTEAQGEIIHTNSYGTSDWESVREWYTHSFNVSREAGQVKMEKLGLSSPYEALLDKFSPGMRVAYVDREFMHLEHELRPMIFEAIDKASSRPAPLPIEGPFPFDKQSDLNRELVAMFGFDFDRGVYYAIKGHPSMGGCNGDARITTRLDEDDIMPGIYGAIHETGHACYEQNMPREWQYQPVGNHMGMAVHESQSMIMEYQAAMTPEFLGHLGQRLRHYFNRASDDTMSADNIRALQLQVEPSFIRIDADQMTYPMHILLRYDLEKKIIAGEINVDDLPEAWSDGMHARLGIRPPSHSQGCMQDVHWPVGLIGYFPAYTFGAMGAAQFFRAAVEAKPEIKNELGQGSTKALCEWLKDNVHGKGSMLTADELFIQATGKTLDSIDYLNHLSRTALGRPYEPS